MPPQDDETARWFAKEVQPHESILRGYLHKIAEWSDVDDLVQETYARLLKARDKIGFRSTRGMIFAIARNAARDRFRRKAVAKTFSVAEIDCSNVLDESSNTPEYVARHQEIELLNAAIQSLPERCRRVLMMRKFENLPYEEIARRLGISVHTVEAQLTKALQRCEKFFIKHGALPPE